MKKINNLQKVFRGANVKNQQKLVRSGTVVLLGTPVLETDDKSLYRQ